MSQELVKTEPGYLVAVGNQDADEARRECLESGFEFTAAHMPRLRVPTGGGIEWQLPEGGSAKTVQGIVLRWHACRGYWPNEFSGGEPPQCSSTDNHQGIGDPGGSCKACPFNDWNSGRGGIGKACKEMVRLWVLREGQTLPTLVSLPPTSLRNWGAYTANIVNTQGRPTWSLVTEISLERTKSKGGIDYAVATFVYMRPLTAEERDRVREFRTQTEALTTMAVSTEDYAGNSHEGVDL